MSCSQDYDTVHLKLGSTRLVSLNLVKALSSGELVASVTSVTDVTNDGVATGDLTIANAAASAASYTDQRTGETVAAGQAVQFTVATSSTTAEVYKLKVIYVTDSTPAETVVDYLYVSFD